MRRTLVLVTVLSAALQGLPLLADRGPDVAAVEAAFLYRFLFFLKDQPADRPDGELCLGILGPDPYGALLDQVEGRSIRESVVRVRRFRAASEVGTCELVFVSPDVAGGVDAAVRALEGRPLLTVSTASGFARQGGIVELRLANERVRFDLSRSAARRNGIRLSAELLEVARRLYP